MLAIVTIYDDCDEPIQSAYVDGIFTGDFNETIYDVETDQNGEAVFITTAQMKKSSFYVDDVDHGTLPYDAGDNVEDSCSN